MIVTGQKHIERNELLTRARGIARARAREGKIGQICR